MFLFFSLQVPKFQLLSNRYPDFLLPPYHSQISCTSFTTAIEAILPLVSFHRSWQIRARLQALPNEVSGSESKLAAHLHSLKAGLTTEILDLARDAREGFLFVYRLTPDSTDWLAIQKYTFTIIEALTMKEESSQNPERMSLLCAFVLCHFKCFVWCQAAPAFISTGTALDVLDGHPLRDMTMAIQTPM